MGELYDDILGPEAAEVFLDSLLKHREHMDPREVEAVETLHRDPSLLTEAHRMTLNELLFSISDDFGMRRRLADLKKVVATTLESEEDELEELAVESERPLYGPSGDSATELVEDLQEDFVPGADDDDGVDDADWK